MFLTGNLVVVADEFGVCLGRNSPRRRGGTGRKGDSCAEVGDYELSRLLISTTGCVRYREKIFLLDSFFSCRVFSIATN